MRTSTSSDLSAGNNRWFFCCMQHSIELWMRNWVSSAYRTISPSLNQYSEIFSFFLESRETVDIENRCIWPWCLQKKKSSRGHCSGRGNYLNWCHIHQPSHHVFVLPNDRAVSLLHHWTWAWITTTESHHIFYDEHPSFEASTIGRPFPSRRSGNNSFNILVRWRQYHSPSRLHTVSCTPLSAFEAVKCIWRHVFDAATPKLRGFDGWRLSCRFHAWQGRWFEHCHFHVLRHEVRQLRFQLQINTF